MFSFHATKLYHSIEGGMLTFKDSGLKQIFDYLKNFGFKGELEVVMPGTNAKMNEMQALMGTLVLSRINDLIQQSQQLSETYHEHLKDVPGIKFPPPLMSDVSYNYAYQPVEIIEEEFGMSRDLLYETLKKYNIYTRRYFYPLLCDYSCYRSVSVRDPLKVARKVSSQILTLPIYPDLPVEDVEQICEAIKYIQKEKGSTINLA
jgi:dTDP-4-amino-4,6-dideoxygalactose transaminase